MSKYRLGQLVYVVDLQIQPKTIEGIRTTLRYDFKNISNGGEKVEVEYEIATNNWRKECDVFSTAEEAAQYIKNQLLDNFYLRNKQEAQ